MAEGFPCAVSLRWGRCGRLMDDPHRFHEGPATHGGPTYGYCAYRRVLLQGMGTADGVVSHITPWRGCARAGAQRPHLITVRT